MNFSEFLREQRKRKKIETIKLQYASLGGEKRLGVSLRMFHLIECGKQPPSKDFMLALFEQSEASERKNLVQAYFKSIYSDAPGAQPLLSYIDQHLTQAIETHDQGLWDTKTKARFYTEEQLEFLLKNPEAVRFHKRVMLLKDCPIEECRLPKALLKELERLELVEITKKTIKASSILYRLPHYENSSPRAVAKATDFILKHMDLFVAREGAASQELSYTMHVVNQHAAQRIIEQMKAFKRWVQSLGVREPGPDDVPLLFMGLAKKVDHREL